MTTLQLQTPAATRKFWSGMVLFCLALLVAPVVATQLGGNYWVRVIDFALLYIMLALGLNIVVGYTGLLDMGFIAFYAVGAYLAALMASPHLLEVFPILNVWFPDGLHTSYLLIIPLAALVAAVCGILLGAPTLKLRGDYGDSDPRFWRNHPHPDAQPRPSAEHHQRCKGHYRGGYAESVRPEV